MSEKFSWCYKTDWFRWILQLELYDKQLEKNTHLNMWEKSIKLVITLKTEVLECT